MIRVGVDVGGTFTDIVLEQTAVGAGQKIFVHIRWVACPRKPRYKT